MVLPATYNPSLFHMIERSATSRRDPAFELYSSLTSFARAELSPIQRKCNSRERCIRSARSSTAWFKSAQAVCLYARSTFLFLLGASALFAQPTSLRVSQYLHKSWTAQEGFFKPGVTGINYIAQTSDGYLWVPGPGFLLRFDGVRFSEWRPPANESLPGKPLRRLLGSKDGSLWIGGVGLAELKADGEFRTYHQLDGTEIDGLIEDKDGGIWAGGGGQPQSPKLCRFYRGEAQCFPAGGFLGDWAGALHADAKGQVWACSNTGIWRLRPGPPLKLVPFSETMPCRALAEDASGTLIFTNLRDLQMITKDGKIVMYPTKVDLAFWPLRDTEGDLWVASLAHGIVHIHDGQTDSFSARDGLSSDNVYQIFQDREGNVWAATTAGLDRFTQPAVPSMTSQQGLPGVFSILMDHKDRLWVGTESGLYRLIDGRLIKSTAKFPDSSIKSLFQTSKGRMLVTTGSTERSMVWFDGDRMSRLATPGGPDVFGFAEDRRGDLWVASRELGLLHLNATGKLIETFDIKILGPFGIALAYDSKRDGLWLVSRLGDLGFFKDGRFVERYGSKDGLGAGVLRDPQVDDDGGVWVGTRVGLAHLKNGRISVLGRKNGLPCDVVHWMRHDRDGNIWLFTECGLVAFSENDLALWIGDPAHTATIRHYLDNTDGVVNLTYNGWFTPQTATVSDGRILFAAEGLSILDPRNLNQNILPPPVHIEEITADEREIRGAGRVTLPARVRGVQIAFTALSFSAPWKVRFRHKLQGYDTDWSSPDSLRQATYTNLPPGHYEFHVIACNNDGLWNTTGDTLSFFIPPVFYQTLWFKILMAVLVLGLLWSLYVLRLRRAMADVQKRLLAQVEERERIARELHDTLLQGFQGITLRVQGVAKNMSVQDPLRKMMEEVLDRGDEVMRDARQRVRNLRRRTTDVNELASRLAKHGEELSHDHAASFALAIVGIPRPLQSTVQDEAYRIAGEALTNAFRHASAAKIEAEVTYDSSALRIRIRDDGVGIQNEVLVNGQPGHWGLAGMRERAQSLGAELNIWSREAAGTEVELVIPASIAYPRVQTKAG
jgi:signal transduction histidine kinase/ligand-binding sensor domain-containing protein